MIDVLIIYPDGTASIERVQNVYPAVNRAMGVQYIQGIYTPGLAFYMDEEGKMNGRAFNPMAQMMYENNGGHLLPGDFIVGPVAITSTAKAPEDDSTPQWVIDKAREMGLIFTEEE